MDNKILEAAQNVLVTNSTKSPERTSKNEALPLHWISALFKKFQARYGHKWTTAIEGIEDIAVKEWAEGMAGLSGAEIAFGIDSWQESWPPSLPEFRNTCLNKKNGLNEHGLNYVPEYLRHKPIKERSRLLSSDERNSDREHIKDRIEEIKKAIRHKP